MSDPSSQNETSGFESSDTIIIVNDGPGDTTVRPIRAEILKDILAERERLAHLQEMMKQSPPSEEGKETV